MSPYDADVDTSVLGLSPELLAALRSIAPPKRRRVFPYLIVTAILAVAAFLGQEKRTRDFFAGEWHRSVATAFVAAVVETPRVGSTPAASTGYAAPVEASAAAADSESPEAIAIAPTEVPSGATVDPSPPWKSAGKINRPKARTKAAPRRR